MIYFVGVGIGIGVGIDIAIGSELSAIEMRAASFSSSPDCDCDPDSDSDPDWPLAGTAEPVRVARPEAVGLFRSNLLRAEFIGQLGGSLYRSMEEICTVIEVADCPG